VAACIGVFFIAMADWGPSADWQELADFSVTWVLPTYIWVQMGSLIGVTVLLSRQVVDVGGGGVG
jgi:hypothetical protein